MISVGQSLCGGLKQDGGQWLVITFNLNRNPLTRSCSKMDLLNKLCSIMHFLSESNIFETLIIYLV